MISEKNWVEVLHQDVPEKKEKARCLADPGFRQEDEVSADLAVPPDG